MKKVETVNARVEKCVIRRNMMVFLKKIEQDTEGVLLKKMSAKLRIAFGERRFYIRNGFKMVSWLSIFCSWCMSSEYKIEQPLSSAAAIIIES